MAQTRFILWPVPQEQGRQTSSHEHVATVQQLMSGHALAMLPAAEHAT